MNFNLKGRKAIVTGASEGIGRAIAFTLAAQGCSVAGIGRNAQTISDLGPAIAARAEQDGSEGKYMGYVLDVSRRSDVKMVVPQILADLGGVDIVVNNAGVTRDRLMMEMEDDDIDLVFATNLFGPFDIIRTLARDMLKASKSRPFGRIVNIGSIVGIRGEAGQANYAAAKGALNLLTLSLAKEFGKRKITCNCVCPGYVETRMTSKLPDPRKEEIIKRTPLGRATSLDGVANMVAFLCSDLAQDITGQVIAVDCGLSL